MRKKSKYEKEYFTELVKSSESYVDLHNKLDLGKHSNNRVTVKKYIKEYGIDVSHFKDIISKNLKELQFKNTIPLNEILVENSTYNCTTNLKNKLYKAGLKSRICEECGQDEMWRGKKISLILDHVNGINTDNRIENLRIVCPNCNATLATHCRGYKGLLKNKDKKQITQKIKNSKNKKDIVKNIIKEENTSKNKILPSRRKVERPPVEQIIAEVIELGYCATGRKYGVSDNAIRKWIK